MSSRIFISYRRADSRGFSHAIYNYLVDHFGEPEIFMDVDDIEPGSDFHDILKDAVDTCDVMIVLIGPKWINITDAEGNRRLDNPLDFVRIEVSRGLERDIKVIPVLVDGAQPVKAEELPENLKPLARLNVLFVGDQFNMDMDRLVPVIERTLGDAKEKRERKVEEKEKPLSKSTKKFPKWALLGGGLVSIAVLIGLAIGLGNLIFNGSSVANNNIPSEEPVVEEMEEPAEEPIEEENEAPAEESALVPGSAEHPIKILLPPFSYSDVDLMIESSNLIAQFFEAYYGYYVEVSIPTSIRATIEEMCASPDNTIGFLPAIEYVIANQKCGVVPGLAVVFEMYGWNVSWVGYYVHRESEFETLSDLEGAVWASPDLLGFYSLDYPLYAFEDIGVELGEHIDSGSDTQAVLDVYNGLADLAIAYFAPPVLQGDTWTIGDRPDVPTDQVDSCAPNESRLYCGDLRVLDPRAKLAEDYPDIVQQVRILDISPEFPYDTVAFSPNFPEELQEDIIVVLTEFINSDFEDCANSLCNPSFYHWSSVKPISDENFDGFRFLVWHRGITFEDIDW